MDAEYGYQWRFGNMAVCIAIVFAEPDPWAQQSVQPTITTEGFYLPLMQLRSA